MTVRTYCASVEPLRDPEIYARAYGLMPEYRRRSIDDNPSLQNRMLSIGADLLLRKALMDLRLDTDTSDIIEGRYGKPAFVDDRIQFNLSHSGDRVMCCVSEKEVGCDVERIRDMDIGIARRHFTKDEQELILSQDDDERMRMFFRIWTLKESFMKATGCGMNMDLRSFTIHIKDGISVECESHPGDFRFAEFDRDGYHYAVCSCGDDIDPLLREADLNTILSELSTTE